ncbi:aminoacyl-histidine dipeptidase [Brevibacillus daliensis]|uniref:aminoacyl-histidine dipeptidase n=1 Tax=Brevibacillus daliensis TaxID=2892995 RepID=UPI001E5C2806|nr:aminoacyl-histidine dipeptidase [Brevibacillus daliensis]
MKESTQLDITTVEGILKHPVFHSFNQLSQIPRGSGNEHAVSNYLMSFAKELGLDAIQDEALNLIIKKPATQGFEAAPAIILQGHMDMVCEKNKGTTHDFDKDPLQLRVKDGMLYATDTTLGADNGIAVAYMMALLSDKNAEHPAIEALITTEEESTMGGALAVDFSNMDGQILLNLDGEAEGVLLVSCAGGVTARQRLPIEWDRLQADRKAYRLWISGLFGGHSGAEIHKERGNANKLLGRVLSDAREQISLQIQYVHGGMKTNAIPREAEAIIFISIEQEATLQEIVEKWQMTLQKELRVQDPNVQVSVEQLEAIESAHGKETKVLSEKTASLLLSSILLTPNGVKAMSMDIENLVESSNNLGVIRIDGDMILLENEVRSSVATAKEAIVEELRALATLTGATLATDSSYPEWAYRPDSMIRPLCVDVYEKVYGKPAQVEAVHAGLECGVFAGHAPYLDMISFGPNIYDPHTPDEHVDILSTIRVWEYLLEVLQATKDLQDVEAG